MYQHVHTFRTLLHPAIILYCPVVRFFVVGTYQQVSELSSNNDDDNDDNVIDSCVKLDWQSYVNDSDKCKTVNGRVGTLEVYTVDSGQVAAVYHHQCKSGGVFDIRLLSIIVGENNDSSEENRFSVAHANGDIAIYRVVKIVIQSKPTAMVELLMTLPSGTAMLTTINNYHHRHVSINKILTIIAGSDDGKLIVASYDSENNTGKLLTDKPQTLTQYSHPIWYIYSIRSLVFVGSEDSKWRIVTIERLLNKENDDDENDGDKVQVLYTNSDATAGVTSFASLEPVVEDNDDNNQWSTITIAVGSYDEYLRVYRIDKHDDDDQQLQLQVTLNAKIHINDGGIWRQVVNRNATRILLAAMWGGVYVVKLNSKHSHQQELSIQKTTNITAEALTIIKNIDNCQQPLSSFDGQLIYGIAVDDNHDHDQWCHIMYASYNDNLLYLICKK